MKKKSGILFFVLLISCCFSVNKAIGQRNIDTAYVSSDSTSLYGDEKFPTEKFEDNNEPIASGEEIAIVKRSVSSDSIRSIQNDKDFFYMNYIDSLLRADQAAKKKEPEEKYEPSVSFWNLPWVKNIFWGLAIAIVCFILYKLFMGNGGMFMSNKKQMPQEIKMEEEVSENDIDGQIQKAILNKNYRLAVRYQFLKTLYKLGEKGILQLAVDKTNYQYTNELLGKPFASQFSSLSLQYEYVWFGEFIINENQFLSIQKQHEQFLKAL